MLVAYEQVHPRDYFTCSKTVLIDRQQHSANQTLSYTLQCRVAAQAWEVLVEGGEAVNGNMLQASAPSGRASVAILFLGDLVVATNGFSTSCRIGGGGFGNVYKVAPQRLAGLGSDTMFVAVKRLNGDSLQGHAEFLQEVQVLGSCRHANVLALIGFSADRGSTQEDDGVCLVTPLMKGGSLEDRLLLNPEALRRLDQMPGAPPAAGWAPLTWQQRLLALLGALAGVLLCGALCW